MTNVRSFAPSVVLIITFSAFVLSLIPINGRASENATTIPATRFDFDGDRKSDISVFRPSEGNWYIANSTGGYRFLHFGLDGDQPIAADYDGDGKFDIAVYRAGVWYQLSSLDNSFSAISFGLPSDLPIPADFDGDSKDDIAVFRPAEGMWYAIKSSDRSYSVNRFGLSEDIPLPADFDGDGKADLNVYRSSEGMWYRINSGNGMFSAIRFGIDEDIPLRGDFDGDRKDDVAVWRPSSGVWYIQRSIDATLMAATFGLPTDIPVPADYDGDGKTDIAVYRPSDGVWHRIDSSTSAYSVARFGIGSDIPVPLARYRRYQAGNINCTWFVSPNGLRTNAGTQASPWNLAHALSGAGGTIRPGNTVCVMGGTYPGRYRPSLNGTASQQIVVRSYPGQRVVIDGGLPVTSLTASTGTGLPYTMGSITLADSSNLQVGSTVRVGTENMQVNSINHTTRVATVVRGWGGSCSSGSCQSWPGGTPLTGYFSVFDVTGSYTWYMGLEITNTVQVSRLESLGQVDLGAGLFDGCTVGCKFINNVIHNTAGGIGSFNNSSGNEYYGNISFYNGWDDTVGNPGNPGRGHGMYLQNSSATAPPKRSIDNISFSNFGYNMQAYTDQGGIHNMEFIGNVFFWASNPILLGPTYNFLIGGGNQPFIGARFISNFTYNPTISGVRRGTDAVGWGDAACTSPIVQDNYFASGDFELSINCSSPTVTGNTFYTHFSRESSFPNNTYHHNRPTTARVFVRPNTYEPGRGNVVVFNWNRSASVSVDLAPLGLAVGQRYQVRDVQNYNGGPVATGTYGGAPVSIPMTGMIVSPIYGAVNRQPTHSDMEFGAFVVLPY